MQKPKKSFVFGLISVSMIVISAIAFFSVLGFILDGTGVEIILIIFALAAIVGALFYASIVFAIIGFIFGIRHTIKARSGYSIVGLIVSGVVVLLFFVGLVYFILVIPINS